MISRPIGIITNYGHKSVKISRTPSSMLNSIWFVEAQPSSRYTNCPRCSVDDRCKTCLNKIMGVFLLNLTDQQFKELIQNMYEVSIPNFTEALVFIGIDAQFEIFNQRRIRYLETKYSIHICLYQKDGENVTKIIREPRKVKFEKRLNLMLKEDLPITSHGLIESFTVIQNKKLLPVLYVCKETKN